MIACGPFTALQAQTWNDARSRSLVERATERRAKQLADTALADYKASAHGYLTFLAQLGAGFTEPPKIVKADELALDIYWRAPNLSKQVIYGRRDTLLLPTDISYHRDHLGIVQNNFPAIIRLGDGDEVQDVPHPLSAPGLEEYDFAIRDSLQIRLGPRTLDVYEVRVRPRNDRLPRAIGALFIDRESGEVVRMALSFTRSALRDKELDDVSVVLENGMIDGRFWLPRRQEIEIRRSGTWLDYPARGIIRGRWEICCYEVNRGIARGVFTGPEIVSIPRQLGGKSPVFSGNILDSLPPDVRAATDEDVRKVQDEARALVRGQALARTRSTSLSANRVSDFVRFNRNEGLALGQGLRVFVGDGLSLRARGRFGFGDHETKGEGEVAWERADGAGVAFRAYKDFREAGEAQERSTAINSIAAQEFGSDYTTAWSAAGQSIVARAPSILGWIPQAEFKREVQRPLAINARSATGSFAPVLPALRGEAREYMLFLRRPLALAPAAFEVRASLSGGFVRFEPVREGEATWFSRFSGILEAERPLGGGRLVLRTVGGWVSDPLAPVQYNVFFGGPVTAPGYEFHSIYGQGGVSQRVELRLPVPVPTVSLARYGRTPNRAPLALYANVATMKRPDQAFLPLIPFSRIVMPAVSPSVGIAILPLFELIRVDIARGLTGGRWSLYIDVGRDFWGIL